MNAVIDKREAEHDEDDVGELGTAQERLARLYERKDDLHSNLKHIDEQLAKLGYNIDSVETKEAKKELKVSQHFFACLLFILPNEI
jgi:hypothetical protein